MGFASLLIGLYLSAKKWFPNQISSQSLIVAFTTLVLFHSFYIELLPNELRPWLFVLLILAKSALVILLIAAGKALLYDAATAPILVRILCLLLTGLALYCCGFVLKKIELWKS